MLSENIAALVRRVLAPIDFPLLAILGLLMAYALVVQLSASSDAPARINAHLLNVAVALAVMWILASVPLARLMNLAVPLYVVGLLLLVATALFGDISKGARRWLNLGVIRVQPSEVMKIAMPMMLAWYFHQREETLRVADYMVAALLLLMPVALIVRQPDLGTAILVVAAGFFVIFFAGLPWKFILGMFAAAAAAAPFAWSMLHDYQRQRILTLIDPEADPLGKGFHIIQSTIAVGSGGIFGKGWLNGTQAHLEFLPERHTDFVLAVLSEEFGLIGISVLIALYALLIGRGMLIASSAPTMFARLLAGSITLTFFTYVFVNMGMVTGILPVVGVPLPFVSYGGTALVTLSLGVGILMSVQRGRQFVQT
ncbi:MAG: rod shape-determining protein RodA [Sterolibacteriaceae bacterium]|nr:rod shape-determining protein RodA [Candidatus Methylophosphatis haderslevensis]